MRKLISTLTMCAVSSFLLQSAVANTVVSCNSSLISSVLQQSSIDPKVLSLALKAHDRAEKAGVHVNKEVLTVIDYRLPSDKKRLWVIDLKNQKVLYNLYVAHGKGSGDRCVHDVSDAPRSQETSVGLFYTEGTYYGRDGYSLRINGLEPGFNGRALSRAVIIHGAAYVSPEFIRDHHRAGRSWGCPAVDRQYARPLIDAIKNGSLVFSYYPERRWLASSKFLHNVG